MLYPWPILGSAALQEGLDIAMDYLEFTDQAAPLVETQRICVNAILAAWHDGTRHRIKLANCAIVAVEKGIPLAPFSQSFPGCVNDATTRDSTAAGHVPAWGLLAISASAAT